MDVASIFVREIIDKKARERRAVMEQCDEAWLSELRAYLGSRSERGSSTWESALVRDVYCRVLRSRSRGEQD